LTGDSIGFRSIEKKTRNGILSFASWEIEFYGIATRIFASAFREFVKKSCDIAD
jgi:hypothetical protein